MQCVANFEIGSDVSVVADDLVLVVNDPHKNFKARLKNIPRSEFIKPFLLSLHIYFEAQDLEQAKEVANDLLSKCLNMLAFTTGAGFRKHRIRQIVNADEPFNRKTRSALIWSNNIEYEDPQPFLTRDSAYLIERLLQYTPPPAIKRALRWYRLGIDTESPDDQFTYFWFALEIVAEFKKPPAKVHDKCPHCQSPLFCSKCSQHPKHKPYAKQAIRALIEAADEKCDDATVALLDKTRNSLMHGATLREIENSLPKPHESVVDILGRILLKALVRQFPKDAFNKTLAMGVPSTYVHYKTSAVAHVEVIVPVDKEGYFELDFKGLTVELKPDGSPQSGAPTMVMMRPEQYNSLQNLSYIKSNHQELLKRIAGRAKATDTHIAVLVLATDMTMIRQTLEAGEDGEIKSFFRNIFRPADSSV